MPGRKSDVNDAMWIADLLARHEQRIQKTLEDANIKIVGLISNIYRSSSGCDRSDRTQAGRTPRAWSRGRACARAAPRAPASAVPRASERAPLGSKRRWFKPPGAVRVKDSYLRALFCRLNHGATCYSLARQRRATDGAAGWSARLTAIKGAGTRPRVVQRTHPLTKIKPPPGADAIFHVPCIPSA